MDEDRRAERLRFRRAASVLRGQLGLVLVLSLLLMVDVTGQVADFFRRWDDPLSIVLGLACMFVLSFTLWTSARRIILAAETGEPTALTPRRLLIAGLIAAVVGVVLRPVTGSPVALSLAVVIGILLALDFFAWFAKWKPDTTQQQGAEDRAQQAIGVQSPEDRAAIQKLGRFVAALPVAVVGIELVKAGVGPLILGFQADGYTVLQGAVPLLVGLVVTVVGCVLLPERLARKDAAEAAPGSGWDTCSSSSSWSSCRWSSSSGHSGSRRSSAAWPS